MNDTSMRNEAFGTFPIDVLESESETLVRADLPGVPKNDLELSFEDNVMTIDGRRSDATRLRRRLRFDPGSVDADRIDAELSHGTLTVRLGKPEALKPRQVPVKAG